MSERLLPYGVVYKVPRLDERDLVRARVIAAGLLLGPERLHWPEHARARLRVSVRRGDGGWFARHRDDGRIEIWATTEEDARDICQALIIGLSIVDASSEAFGPARDKEGDAARSA
jgi:hypothetical protein